MAFLAVGNQPNQHHLVQRYGQYYVVLNSTVVTSFVFVKVPNMKTIEKTNREKIHSYNLNSNNFINSFSIKKNLKCFDSKFVEFEIQQSIHVL